MKATFGSGIGDAVLDIPLTVTSNSKTVIISYKISSCKIELLVLQRKAGVTEVKYEGEDIAKNTKSGSLYKSLYISVDADVEAIGLVARKTGVSKNVEYVLVTSVEMKSTQYTGNMPLLHRLHCI